MRALPPQADPHKREPPSGGGQAQDRVFDNYNYTVNVGNIYAGRAPRGEFETLDPKPLWERGPMPHLAHEFAEKARNKGLLVFGGVYEEKPDIARQVALLVRDLSPSEEKDAPPKERPLREMLSVSSFADLRRAIRAEKDEAILLLHDVQPRDVADDLGPICAEFRKKHIILMTTDCSMDSWERALQGLPGSWQELPPDQLFDPQELAHTLLSRIVEKCSKLRAGVFEKEERELLRSRIGGMTLIEIANRLQTPRRIDAFVEHLCSLAEKQCIDMDAVNKLIGDLTSIEREIDRWFNTRLRPDEQVLAIGLNFFSGLLDNQCFSALEQWVSHIRTHRDPTQRTFDYVDVENLKYYFPEKSDSMGIRFRARSSAHWRHLFAVAWRNHRRKIISALPVLTRMAARSDDWELNESEQHLNELRFAVGDTLAEIGTHSASGVQSPLLHLASSRDEHVQVVAARAIASWRGIDQGKQFFETMKRWREDARLREIVKRFMPAPDSNDPLEPQEFIQATIALTLAIAATYDPPNRLNSQMVELVMQSAAERHHFVQRRFVYTMRSVAEHHLKQFRDKGLLRTLLRRHPDLALTIGSSIAHVSPYNPKEVSETLRRFHAESKSPQSEGPTRITLMRTLAYAYGSMDYGSSGALTAEEGFERLLVMLKQESEPEIRAAAFEAVAFQALRNFSGVESHLRKLMAELDPGERDKFVGLLAAIYLIQRQALRGGDVWMRWKEHDYVVWLNSARPLTDIEKAMQTWIQDPDSPAAQQIALRASLSFIESLDAAEARFIKGQNQQREHEEKRNAVPQGERRSSKEGAASRSWYTHVFVPTLATLFTRAPHRAEHRRIVSGLLAGALNQHGRWPGGMAFMLERWKRQGDPNMAAIVQKLQRAMKWHPYAGWLPITGGLALLLLGALTFLR